MGPNSINTEGNYSGSAYDSALELPEIGATTVSNAAAYATTTPVKRAAAASPFRFNKLAVIITAGVIAVIVLVGTVGAMLSGHHTGSGKTSDGNGSGNYAVGSIPLQRITENKDLSVGQADHLTINGELRVRDTLVLAPSAAPLSPTAGQIYYDQKTNAPYFYNGSAFVSLAPTPFPQHVSSIGGSSGSISVGNGLQITSGQLGLSNAVVQSIASAVNAANKPANAGGVLTLAAGTSSSLISSDGAGNYTLSNKVVVGTGTAGDIAVFTGSGTVGSSLLNQAGGAVTVSGGLKVTGALTTDTIQHSAVGNDLNITAEGKDIIFTANGRTFTLPNSGVSTQTICTSDALCASGNGVAVLLGPSAQQSYSGSGSAIAVRNTGTGNLIDLQGAGSDRFTVTNGGNVTVTGTLNIGGAITGATTGNTINGLIINSGALSGVTGYNQTSGNFSQSGAGSFSTGTGSVSLNGATSVTGLTSAGIVRNSASGLLSSGTVTLGADTTGSYVSSIGTTTGITLGGTSGAGGVPTLAVNYGAAANTAVQGSTTLTCAAGTGNLSGGGNTITLGSGGSCGNISISNSPVFSGALTVQGSGGITVGVAGTTAGSLSFANGSNSNMSILQSAVMGQSTTFTLPDPGVASASICLSTGNCAGAGSGITGSGTSGKIAKFSSSNNIVNSGLSESGTTLSYAGNVVVNSAAGFSGNLLDLQVAGVSKLSANQAGAVSVAGGLNVISGGATIVGNSSVTGTLGVSAGFTVSGGGAAITGNSSVTGTLGVSNTLSVAAGGLNVTGNSTITGTLSSLTGLSSSGAITFSGLSTAGVVHTNASGALSTSAVVLGTETLGNYVSALGTLTGLTATANSGAGSTPGISVNYGSVANTSVEGNKQVTVTAGTGLSGGGTITLGAGGTTTLNALYGAIAGTAVQGNVSLTCAAGTGNLSGGGDIITLGSGGTCSNISITNNPTFSGTLSVQGAGGATIGVAGTTTGVLKLANSSNTNVGSLSIAALGQATTYTLPDPGSASASICLSTGNCAGAGGGITGSGTAGKLTKFSGTGTVTDSSLSESGTTVTAVGNVVIQGANSLSLGTATTANGSVTFYGAAGTRSVTLQAPSSDPASNLVFKLPSAYGSANDCLKSDGLGGLSFVGCTGGAGGGVTSLDGQTGVLTINNTTASAGAITINNAKADGATKGIATYNATNFSDNGSGVINTVQNINSTATPTFGGLTLSTALTVANGGTGATTAAGARSNLG
ncbi:MAG: hypothetical protein QFB87_05585, partial [Patescibacteria group bacterium]|nr:hypothetical protein [Patescibacteria group bacterium]